MRLRYLWHALVAFLFILTFFGIFSMPKDWVSARELLTSVEAWWVSHAADPIASAFLIGLAFATIFIPEALSLLRDHLFPRHPRPDILALEAYWLIRKRSKWIRQQEKNWRKLPTELDNREGCVEQTLNTRLHTLLRQDDLKSWGCPHVGAEIEEPIPAEKWSTMEMKFD